MDLLTNLSSDASTWDAFIKSEDIDLRGELNNCEDDPEDSWRRLPRSDVSLYGMYPKVDGRVLSVCVSCKSVFHPQHISDHTCSEKDKLAASLAMKKKAKRKKKTQSSPLPPPPIFQEPVSPLASVTTKLSTLDPYEMEAIAPAVVSPQITAIVDTLPASPISGSSASILSEEAIVPLSSSDVISSSNSLPTSSSSSSFSNSNSKSSSSRHRNKKRKSAGDYDSLQSQKQLVTTTTSHKSLHNNMMIDKKPLQPPLKIENVESADGSGDLKMVINEKDAKKSSTFMPVIPKIERIDPVSLNKTTTSLPNGLHSDISSDSKYYNPSIKQEIKQEIIDSPKPPEFFTPMSPVAVVSPSQLMQVQVGINMVRMESPQPASTPPPLHSQPMLWKIPDSISNVKVYKTHPKPAVLPTYGAKKIGGAILLSNHRVESQYNDIQLAITTKRKASNSNSNFKSVSVLNNSIFRPDNKNKKLKL